MKSNQSSTCTSRMIWTSNHQSTSLSVRVTVVGVWEGGGVANFPHVQWFGRILILNTNYCSGPNINFLALSFCFCSSYSSQWTWKQKHPTAKVCLCLWVVCASRRKSSDPHIKESFDSKINKSGHDCAVDEARLSASCSVSDLFIFFPHLPLSVICPSLASLRRSIC